MIRCFRVKNKEERAKIGHLIRGRKIEAGEYATRENIRVAEPLRVGRDGIPLNRGVRDGGASRTWFICVQL
ncbi:hypothetical protein KY289_005323 [Solanum tuberosum]|nr:hypothetical protein KY289_005321 [Solanum tuberosum]KAH0722279.1 hypothetical protein KY289_005323 [Solanum tuberosum]